MILLVVNVARKGHVYFPDPGSQSLIISIAESAMVIQDGLHLHRHHRWVECVWAENWPRGNCRDSHCSSRSAHRYGLAWREVNKTRVCSAGGRIKPSRRGYEWLIILHAIRVAEEKRNVASHDQNHLHGTPMLRRSGRGWSEVPGSLALLYQLLIYVCSYHTCIKNVNTLHEK